MKARALIALLLTGLVAGTLAAPSAVAAKAKKATVVGEDAAGDWGMNVDPTIAPIGDTLGQDLVAASIQGDSKTLNFIISLNALPPSGGVPEVSRYLWDLNVDGEPIELDGKFTNYSRGACDPTSGQCQAGPRDPGLQPFIVRGECVTDTTLPVSLELCQEFGVVQATFDPATATITIPVPASMIKAKKGTKITGGTNIFGGSISAAPAAFLTSGNFPNDTLTITKTFVVK